MDFYLDIIIKLAVSVLLGSIIGIERAGSNHDAGLRTHILVSLGAAGIMIMSSVLVSQYQTDISRIGAQVVSGIGFLGAGCILVKGDRVSGLTTAAGLWTTACVGLATGMGYYYISVPMTFIMLLSMVFLRPLTNKLQNLKSKEITFRIFIEGKNGIKSINKALNDINCDVVSIIAEDEDVYILKIAKTSEPQVNNIFCALLEDSSIKQIERL